MICQMIEGGMFPKGINFGFVKNEAEQPIEAYFCAMIPTWQTRVLREHYTARNCRHRRFFLFFFAFRFGMLARHFGFGPPRLTLRAIWSRNYDQFDD